MKTRPRCVFIVIVLTVFLTCTSPVLAFISFQPRNMNLDPDVRSAVLIKMAKSPDGVCTGTLLSDRWVLTAARCLYSGTTWIVEKNTSLMMYAGVFNTNNLTSERVQARRSKKFVVHDLPGGNNYFSIALIKAENPFVLEHISPSGVDSVPVARYGFKDVRRKTCKVGGFGGTDWSQPIGTSRVKKEETPVGECNCSKGLEDAFPLDNTRHWLCTTPRFTQGLCRGDFGAGLECDGLLQGVAIAILSLKRNEENCLVEDRNTTKCGRATTNVFLDICYYLPWINTYEPMVRLNTVTCRASNENRCCYHILVLIFVLYTAPGLRRAPL